MRRVEKTDKDGKIYARLLRDEDSDDSFEKGIPLNPPQIDDILDKAKISIHNKLVKHGITDYSVLKTKRHILSQIIKNDIEDQITNRYIKVSKGE